MPKYAPARESDGYKPWVVTSYQWGRESRGRDMGRIYNRLNDIYEASIDYKPRGAESERKTALYGPLAVELGHDRSGREGNTRIRKDKDGTLRFRFHDTDIVVARPDGKVTVWHGGWPTTTTAGRMQEVLGYGNQSVRHTYRKNKWPARGRYDQKILISGAELTEPMTLEDD